MVNSSPLESAEQIALVEWLELQGLRFTSVPNSTYTKSWNQKRKNYWEGLRPGFSDLIILIAPNQSKDGEGYFLCIEMKRKTGGSQSKDQKGWEQAINGLKTALIQYYLCKGADEAIKVVSHYLKTVDNSDF